MSRVSTCLPVSLALAFSPPLAPVLVDEPPRGDIWLHEIKHDGFRTQLVIANGSARAFSRRGHDWSDRYRRIVTAAAALPCSAAIIDGEAIVQDESGRSSMELFYAGMERGTGQAVMFAFDLMHLDGEDLRKLPLEDRRARLRELIGPDPHAAIQFSEALTGDGAKIFAAAERMGLEGIVSKRLGSRYKSGTSREWLKTKCMTEGEFVVVGAAPNPGGAPFALLARETGGELVYAGSAFVTLKQADRDRFWGSVEALKVAKPVVAGIGSRKAGYCRPELRVRARHLRGEAMLRHASLTEVLE
jgi:DNA ligase D-like protein (predicted ligase)